MRAKLITIVAATCVTMGMSACSPPEPDPDPSPVSEYTEESPTESTDDAQTESEKMFVEVLREEMGSNLSPNDQDLINLGEAVCESFDEGLGLYESAEAVQEGGFSEYDSGFIIGAAVYSLCTEHLDEIEVEEESY